MKIFKKKMSYISGGEGRVDAKLIRLFVYFDNILLNPCIMIQRTHRFERDAI